MKMRTRFVVGSIIAVLLVVAAIVATPVPVRARVQEPGPVFLRTTCYIQDSDRALVRYHRDGCDVLADSSGYRHGVLRPENPSDANDPSIRYVCPAPPPPEKFGPSTNYLCFGVGPK
jgi:hypothetical protein